MANRSDAVVVGVYPSAWHVRWQAPETLVVEGRRGTVAALAVDVEPTVLWDGNADKFGERLARWKSEVGFVDGKHGTVSLTSPSTNGSSGAKVVEHYLGPLGIAAERTTFTDVYPVFLVKMTKGQQGEVIRREYDTVASGMGMPKCSVPPRISSARLPELAASIFGGRLVADLSSLAARLIITLGEAVWNTFLAIPSLRARPPRQKFADLYGDSYGTTGRLTVNGHEIDWLPLVHPGLLKGKLDPNADIPLGGRTLNGWATLHARWASAHSLRLSN